MIVNRVTTGLYKPINEAPIPDGFFDGVRPAPWVVWHRTDESTEEQS